MEGIVLSELGNASQKSVIPKCSKRVLFHTVPKGYYSVRIGFYDVRFTALVHRSVGLWPQRETLDGLGGGEL